MQEKNNNKTVTVFQPRFSPESSAKQEKVPCRRHGTQLVEKPCLKEKSPFLQGEYEGETGEAPPAAEKASRFRG
ncbi:MAG: hypothetical protein ACI4O6_10155, partial [Dysosmobacter sp.]